MKETEKMLEIIANHVRNDERYSSPELAAKYSDLLLSLKSQPHWKPSDEQLEALRLAINNCCLWNIVDENAIKSLYEELQKL